MNESILMLSQLSEKDRSDVLRWFARQAEEVRIELMKARFYQFHKLRKRCRNLQAPLVDYCAFLRACRDGGWEAERRFRSSRSLVDTDTQRLARNRLAKAKAKGVVRVQKRELIARHWGKIVELHSAGVSYRKIATYLRDEHRCNVSHTLLRSLIVNWKHAS